MMIKDLPLLSQDWNVPPAASTTTIPVARVAPSGCCSNGLESRKTSISTIGMELERQLGIQDAAQQVAAPLSSLRHPDGASDPHLNHHSSATYETDRPGYFTST